MDLDARSFIIGLEKLARSVFKKGVRRGTGIVEEGPMKARRRLHHNLCVEHNLLHKTKTSAGYLASCRVVPLATLGLR